MSVVLVSTSRLESQTWDEGIHISAGLSYWKTGDYRLNPEHPVLPKLLCAAPLLFTDVKLPLTDESWKNSDQVLFARKFLYENRLPPPAILLLSRSVSIAVALGLGAALAYWTRARFGASPALLALTLYVADPNMLAHGRYVTTDIWVAAFSFLACILWCEALLRRTYFWYAAAGIALGLALGSKFSALYLLPVFFLVGALRRPSWKGTLLCFSVSAFVLALPYAPEVRSSVVSALTGTPIQEPVLSIPLAATTDNGTVLGKWLHQLGAALHLPSFSYLAGLASVASHVKGGHWAYLLGEASQEGWWYYFPVAFAVKTPLATLLLSALALVVALWKRPKVRPEMVAMLVPFLLWWGVAVTSRLNIGLRHILPVYPFLFVMIAVAAVRYLPSLVWGSALLVLIVESASIYPHYLAFFNAAAGGPEKGPEYLLDSNIDWGQDMYKLKAWMERNTPPGTQVCSAYFGQAFPSLAGLNEAYLPRYNEPEMQKEMNCIAAASVTLLYSGYSKADDLRHLRRLEPLAKIGYSIYLYDFRKPKP